MLEDSLLQSLQLRGGVYTQFGHQVFLSLPIGTQCLGLSAIPIERYHVPCPEPLVQRMLGRKSFEFADHGLVTAEGQIGINPSLDCQQPEILETANLILKSWDIGKVGVRPTAPQ